MIFLICCYNTLSKAACRLEMKDGYAGSFREARTYVSGSFDPLREKLQSSASPAE